MPTLLDQVHVAFQPLVNTNTGGVVAVEALARPLRGHVHDLFRTAAEAGRLTELDIELAVLAVQFASEHETLLPLHLNILADTVVEDPAGMEALFGALRATGRRPREVILEIGDPISHLDQDLLLERLRRLRTIGFLVALDGIGGGDIPLTFLLDVAPNLVKLDRAVLAGLPEDSRKQALLEGLAHTCKQAGATVIAQGVETREQLQAVRAAGIHLVQGDLIAPPSRRPNTRVTLSAALNELSDVGAVQLPVATAGPRITEYLCPATMLAEDATADAARKIFADRPDITSIVLVDTEERPLWTIDRNRFLLAVTGPYGHALHAKRPASRLADEPRAMGTNATAMEALNLMSGGASDRMYDDLVVLDEAGRCLGVVRLSDLFRGMAEMKVEHAAALNPLTRLPGSDAIARDLRQRISTGQIFAVSWLDVDNFKWVNDNAGFAAGDDLIRHLGRGLTDVAASLRHACVGHVGGDDFLVVCELDDLVRLAGAVLDPDRRVNGRSITVSMATLVCAAGSVLDHRETSRLLAPLKQQAKSLRGSSWVLGRPGSTRTDVLRGQPPAPAPTMQRTG
ncbi:GGDEF domain-containing protein [Crossiella cryophila]|uniref:Diguanylate cyclase (GGDEF)-like protein n=1 Tax=Crossiella cryophila TaxID=43355 RepID=A0A7W7CDC1_9PSEU|nr:GGDEF domain-containing protein [Crossiella cryophila]MBB4677763.1 diguanylate cyclase (GGDEF)-like protein [Crossiella cryophila]